MSLQDVEIALKALAASDELTLYVVAQQVPPFGYVLAALPPVGDVKLAQSTFSLNGSGSDEKLTVKGTVNWGLLNEASATIEITPDASKEGAYLSSLEIDSAPSANLSIPGLHWFSFGEFLIGGRSLEYIHYSSELSPSAVIDLGTTLHIQGDSSNTGIPILIEEDPVGDLLLKLNTSSIDLPTINDILAAFGTTDKINLPSTLNELLNFSLLELSVGFNPNAKTISQLGVKIGNSAKASDWKILPGVLAVESYEIGLTVLNPLQTQQVTGLIATKILLGTIDIEVFALHPATGGWDFKGVIAKDNPIHISDITSGLAEQFHVSLPAALDKFILKDFEFEFNTSTGESSGKFTVDFELDKKSIELTVSAHLQKPQAPPELENEDKNTYSVSIDGHLQVGSADFNVHVVKGQDTQFTADWKDPAHPIEFGDIARTFGFDVSSISIPPKLDLNLVGASLTYDFTKKLLLLTAESQTYGDTVFIADMSQANAPLYAFGIVVPLHVNFADIPAVGSKFPGAKDIGILDAGVWVFSRDVKTEESKRVNGYIATAQASAPQGHTLPVLPTDADLTERVLLSAKLELGPTTTYPLQLPLGSTKSDEALMPMSSDVGASPAQGNGKVTPPNSSSDGAKWIDIQKTIGPLTMQRLGLKYADSQLYFLLDLGFSAGGLTIDLAGLGVSSVLTDFAPHFHLAGLEIEYKASVFEIAGEFLNMPVQAPVEFEYAGSASLQAGEFDLTALGSYARVSGQTSLFIFAVLEIPLGGPPFFFVTGAAAGFGFNRNLILPEVDDVPNFPLVAAAMNPSAVFPGGSNQTTSLTQALGVMEKYIPPDPGEYWLAAGIRFTSFEMLSSFALVSVAFGNQLEIALLGETQLSIPVDPTGEEPDNEKIANVQLALEVRIDPDAGDFKASAVLTSNSWILDKNCRLTGGFAFYIWYGGEHAGDFVITLGGYNPHYQPAQWYPNEPRLGINWTLSSALTIIGGCYFALTPHAVMAGGSLQILFQLGTWFKAWLTAYIDFLIEWQPFHYEADAGVIVGVSFTFSLFGAKITLTLEIGATVYLSGPPFGGSATIYLWIISVTIPFGDKTTSPPALSFEEFNQAILPKQNAKESIASIAAFESVSELDDGDATSVPIFITPTISSGVIESPTSNKNLTMPIVAASTLEIHVTSNWPAVELWDASKPLSTYPGKFSTTLYARPMHDETGFNGKLSVQVNYEGKDHTDFFILEPILKSAPIALWSKWDKDGPALNPTPDQNGNPTLTIPQVPFGISLRSGVEQDADPSAQIPLENFAAEPVSICVSWPGYPFGPSAAKADAIQQIRNTILDAGVVATRETIRQALKGAGIQNLPDTIVISPDLSKQPDNVFLAVPEVANLGQLPSGNTSRS